MNYYCNGKKGICYLDECPDDCVFFDGSGGFEIEEKKPITNSDHIRSMSDEELAEYLIFWEDDWGRWATDGGYVNEEYSQEEAYKKAIEVELEWLKQPYKEKEK